MNKHEMLPKNLEKAAAELRAMEVNIWSLRDALQRAALRFELLEAAGIVDINGVCTRVAAEEARAALKDE